MSTVLTRIRRRQARGVLVLAFTLAGLVILTASPGGATHGGQHHTVGNSDLGQCDLTGPDETVVSTGGTLITIGLDCERVSGARKINHGFPALGDDLGPLFQFRAESPMGGPDVFRMTDRFYNEATGGTDTLKFAKEIFLAIPVGKVCVTVAGSEKCSP